MIQRPAATLKRPAARGVAPPLLAPEVAPLVVVLVMAVVVEVVVARSPSPPPQPSPEVAPPSSSEAESGEEDWAAPQPQDALAVMQMMGPSDSASFLAHLKLSSLVGYCSFHGLQLADRAAMVQSLVAIAFA